MEWLPSGHLSSRKKAFLTEVWKRAALPSLDEAKTYLRTPLPPWETDVRYSSSTVSAERFAPYLAAFMATTTGKRDTWRPCVTYCDESGTKWLGAQRSHLARIHREIESGSILRALDKNQVPTHSAVDVAAISVSDAVQYLARCGFDVAAATERTSATVAESMGSAGTGHQVRKMPRRANPMAAVIELARKNAVDSKDWPSAWSALVTLAQRSDRPAPLLGYAEGDGVKYQADDPTNPVGWLTREAFRRRLGRMP